MNNYNEIMASAFEDEMKKIASTKISSLSPDVLKALGFAVGGAAGFETLRRANDDRKIGRTMRVQQGY